MNSSRLLILNDNLILDEENKINVPQNENFFFKFNQEFLKNSREIGIHPHTNINLLNLFIIIKSFANNIEYVPYSILIAIRDETTFIAHNLNIDEFKKISYLRFTSWFLKQLEKDATYLKTTSTYSFVFTYPVEIFNRGKLKFLKPNYPWTSQILKIVSKEIDNDTAFLNIIEKQHNEIIKLKKIIADTVNRDK